MRRLADGDISISVIWFKDFSGGENRRFSSLRIDDNESPRLRNARWNVKGALSKRDGFGNPITVTGASRIASIFVYHLSTMAADQMLIAYNSGTTTGVLRSTDLVTFTTQVMATVMGVNYQPEFAVFNDLVIVANGENATQTINASNSSSNLSGAPISRFVVVHKNTLFFFDDPSTPNYSRLQWADSNLTSFTSTNFETVALNDGAVGIGMASFGDELILFKGPRIGGQSISQSSMYALIGSEFDASNPTYSIVNIPLPRGVGLLGHRTIRPYKGALLFATNHGVYAYYGGGRMPENISEKIRDEYYLTSNSGWNQVFGTGNQGRPCAYTWDDKYILAVDNQDESGVSSNNRIYVYEDGKWWIDTIGGTADSFATSGGPSDFAPFGGSNLLYYSSDSTQIIRQFYAGSLAEQSDTGVSAPVNFSYLTKEYDLANEVNFLVCYVHLRRQSSGTLTFGYNVDQRGETTALLDMTSPDSGDTSNTSSSILRKKVSINSKGRTIQFRFHDKGSNDCEIFAIELNYLNPYATGPK